jgi:hypothetical protein
MKTLRVFGNKGSINPAKNTSNPLGLETLARRLANQFCIVQRDDGMRSIGWHDDAAGPFESRRFAESVAVRTAPVLA